ncbi:MAG: T9SS sorting signal type C domain-containing protein [Flavobacterium sp. JAD_PAG50586_2]|nr:MAG: T9SS sorting signal type C domain-containing protein [Flavobacterium sp. JAD_PAG50586_2]
MQLNYFNTPASREATTIVEMFRNANILSTKLILNLLMLLTVFSLRAQCPSPPGNPSVFGNNQWNAYVYDNNDISLVTAVYSGYYVQYTLGFDTLDNWNLDSSPSNAEGWSGCSVDNDAFTYVYKRKGFPCGNYTVAMTNWDDVAEVYVDGVALWSCSSPSSLGICNGYVGDILLNENSEIEVRVREDGGDSFASLSLVNNTPSIAGILTASGNSTICPGIAPSPITLSDFSGSIVKWQSAEDASFTTGVVDILSTSAILTSVDMGILTVTHYYRAVVQDGSCNPEYTNPLEVTVGLPVTYAAGMWSETPTETNPIIIDDNILLVDDLTVCSCQVKSGKTLTIASGTNLTVVNYITVETGADLIINNNGSLLQTDDSAINSGSVKVKRDTQPMKAYDYTYWSSPVANNTLFQLSPLTAGDKYYRFNPIINNWVSIIGGTEVMQPGLGYIVRAPQGWTVNNASSGVYSGEFNGIPTNGVVSTTIQKGAGTYNLIGNPYPSVIDIDLFLTDPANSGIVNGTIYLWTHNTAISSTIPGNVVYNYTADDYAKYNLTGGIRSAAAAITGGTVPDGKIAIGQGFFIEAATGLADGTYSATFRNSMRVDGNGRFYRTSPTLPTNTNTLEKNRLWLNISNTNGAYNQILIGYVATATNGFDPLFDGKTMVAGNVLSMYSIIGTDNFSIQGRSLPFEISDSVVVGYKTTIAGSFTVALEDFDGLFQDQDVYLFDKLLGISQNLKEGSYAFLSEVGTFNDRFEVRFTNSTLGIGEVNFDETNVSISIKDRKVSVHSPLLIEGMEIFDLLGRKVYSQENIGAMEFTTPEFMLSPQVLIAKIKLMDFEITRKIIMK